MYKQDWLIHELETIYGEIQSFSEECPGVYYVAARKDDLDHFPQEYYVADKNTLALSAKAKEYGQPIEGLPGFISFFIGDLYSGQKIVAYEIWRYRLKAHLPIDTSEIFFEFSLYAAEYHPDYFGAYPAPMLTPCGRVVRYQTISNGIYWLETDQAEEMVAFCMPVWEMLSLYTRKLGKYLQSKIEDRIYLFFSHPTTCLPFFELWEEHPEWNNSPMFDFPALMNAIWTYYPDFAVTYNVMEQSGLNSLWVLEEEKEAKPERMLSMTPEIGTDFLKIT